MQGRGGNDTEPFDDVTSNVCNDEVLNKNELPLNIINTNARSLCPKMGSLVDCMSDSDSIIGIVSETWLSDGTELVEDIDHLSLATGVRLLCKNRERNNRGFSLSLIHI